MKRTSLPISVTISLVVVTALIATAMGYMWANAKKAATQSVNTCTFVPKLDAPALAVLAPIVITELKQRCSMVKHPTCDILESEGVKKEHALRAAKASPSDPPVSIPRWLTEPCPRSASDGK